MKFYLLAFAVILGLVFTITCKHEPYPFGTPNDPGSDTTKTNDCDPDTVYFENDILPLLVSNCATSGCHDQATGSKGVRLNNYANIINTGDVRPGNPNGSDLYEVITETRNDKRMPRPPAAPLSQTQINLIKKWIEQGAKNNQCDGCDTTNVKFSSHILPVVQQFCGSCHAASNPIGGISLTNYAQIQNAVQSRNLLKNVQHAPGFIAMPPGGKLPDCEIKKFEIWIAAGAPNN